MHVRLKLAGTSAISQTLSVRSPLPLVAFTAFELPKMMGTHGPRVCHRVKRDITQPLWLLFPASCLRAEPAVHSCLCM